MSEMQKLLAVFREEVRELVSELARDIESLSERPGNACRTEIDHALRITHNIKGAASSVGQEEIATIAHALEGALGRLKHLPALVSNAAIEDLLASATGIEQRAAQDPATDSARDLTARLALLGNGEATPSGKQVVAPESRQRAAASATTADEGPQAARDNSFIRIETARLDRLMAYAGELLVTHSRLTARTERLQQLFAACEQVLNRKALTDETVADLRRQMSEMSQLDQRELQSFGRLTEEMSLAMKQVRMMPLERAAASWRRIVQDCAVQLGREVVLSITGGDIELDKWVLDKLRDPFTHILRNAVDHGIEPAEERARAGKPAVGQVAISAGIRGATVRIEISDDGRGLDAQKIGEAAVQKGVVTREQLSRMQERDILLLLFRAGFSTAEKVSRISGRGVGLDIVQRRVEELSGSVDVQPRSGLGGAAFVLQLPVSLLSTKGLLVRTESATFAVPIDFVVRTLRVRRSELRQVDGWPVVQIDGREILRIRSLGELLGEPAEQSAENLYVLVVARGNAQLGIVVKEVVSEEEFVTKRLPWNLRSVPGVNGAVILANGGLALCVDVPYLFRLGEDRIAGGVDGGANPAGSGTAPEPARTVLVVDDSATSLALESRILSEGGYAVVTAASGHEAWQALQNRAIHLVVSDVQMPDFDGFELTRRIRADARLRELPVVLVTSLSGPEDVARGAAAGANEYIKKSDLVPQRLLDAVARWF